MPEEKPESSLTAGKRLVTILHNLESILNNSPEIRGSINIKIGIAWISLGEGLYKERHEKLHVEGILRIIDTWNKSEELSGFSLYFYDDPDGPYARININKMDISILLDIDQDILSQE
jgi:hypothetical protein